MLTTQIKKLSHTKPIVLLLHPVVIFTLYRLALDLSYRYLMSPFFGSEGFTYSFHFWKWLGLLSLSILVYFAVTDRQDSPSSIFLELLMWMCYAPFACFYALSGRNITFYVYMSICFVCIKLILILPWHRVWSAFDRLIGLIIPLYRRHQDKLKLLLFWLILGICLLLSFLTIAALVFNTKTLNFAAALSLRIYEIRQDTSLPLWASYLVTWQSKTVNIFMLCILFRHKRYWLMVFPILLQLAIYVSLGNRVDLFALALCLFVFFAFRAKRSRSILGGVHFIGVCGLSLFMFVSRHGVIPYSLFRRTYFTQAAISSNYYTFFSNHVKLSFSEGRLGRLIGLAYPYPTYSTKLMMANFSGSMNGGANGFFLSSGFADMGFAGMLIVCVFLSIILVIVDRICERIPLWFSMTVLAVSVFSLMNSSLFTSLGTHGMLLSILLLLLYGIYPFKRHDG